MTKEQVMEMYPPGTVIHPILKSGKHSRSQYTVKEGVVLQSNGYISSPTTWWYKGMRDAQHLVHNNKHSKIISRPTKASKPELSTEFKVGDKVTITKGIVNWGGSMDEYVGKQATLIRLIFGESFAIDLDGGKWCWYPQHGHFVKYEEAKPAENILKEGDRVVFKGPKGDRTYQVRSSYGYCHTTSGGSANYLIFDDLGLSYSKRGSLATEAYGYSHNGGDWPQCKEGDYAALTRFVNKLHELCAKAFKDSKLDLLEEAKLRYPIGTNYKCADHSYSYTVKEQTFTLYSPVTVYGEDGKGCLYHEGKWATIVKEAEPKVPTLEELRVMYPVGTKFRPICADGKICTETFVVGDDWEIYRHSRDHTALFTNRFTNSDGNNAHSGFLWDADYPNLYAQIVSSPDMKPEPKFNVGDMVQVCGYNKCNGSGYYDKTDNTFEYIKTWANVLCVVDNLIYVPSKYEWYYRLGPMMNGHIAEHALTLLKISKGPSVEVQSSTQQQSNSLINNSYEKPTEHPSNEPRSANPRKRVVLQRVDFKISQGVRDRRTGLTSEVSEIRLGSNSCNYQQRFGSSSKTIE
jgi:hypothetical protein